MKILRSLAVLTSIFIASCSSGSTSTVQADTTTTEIATTTTSAIVTNSTVASNETGIDPSTTAVKSAQSTFTAEVWAKWVTEDSLLSSLTLPPENLWHSPIVLGVV
ncbi:MAG: hypothetical protein EBW68_00535 [Actinobacteria bacterium]|nr:hypothetical protein [Actinomycetota bacterium]